jgi:hypothetical protein
LSTLAVEGSGDLRGGSTAVAVLRYADLILLALALPIFLIAGLPMLGYAVLAGVWIAQRYANHVARRRAERLLGEGNRKSALGTIAWTSLGRAWFVAATVLVTGLIEREAGLAAGVLAAVLFSFYLAGEALAGREAGAR